MFTNGMAASSRRAIAADCNRRPRRRSSDEAPEELRLVHAPPHPLDVAAVGRARRAGMPGGRARQRRRQERRLVVAEIGGGLAEVSPAGALDAPPAPPEFADVEVELGDPPLAEPP